jgi:hypothetical protein
MYSSEKTKRDSKFKEETKVVWEFYAFNTESQYAIGTENQALSYAAKLNENRDINLYDVVLIENASKMMEDSAFDLDDFIDD